MYQWLLGALGALLAAARRPAPPPAPPPHKRPPPSVWIPVDDPDETPPKKKKSDSSISECKEKVAVSAAVKLPSKATKRPAASISKDASVTESAEETRSTSFEPSTKRPRLSTLDVAMLQTGQMPCGPNAYLTKETPSFPHKTIPCLSTSQNGKQSIKPAPDSFLPLRPPIKERPVPESAASDVSRMGRLFCTAEEDVQRGEKVKYKHLLELVKEKYPRSRPNPQPTSLCNVQASSKEPVTTVSHLEEPKYRGDVYPRTTLRTGIKCIDVCCPEWSQRGDTLRYCTPEENSQEEEGPVKQTIAGRQRGAEILEDALFQVHPAPVRSKKSPALDVEEKKLPSLGKTVERFTPLTEAMEREVIAAFGKGQPDEIMSSAFKLKVTREDIHTLRNLCWLNDEVVNFYLGLVTERGKKEDYPAAHAFSTFFYPKLTSGGYEAVRRWTRSVDLFKQDIILVPIHLRAHWTLAVIDVRKKTIKYFDSLGQKGDKICQTLLQYLQKESREKRNLELNVSEWTLHSMEPHEIPQQLNGSDCGVFMCTYADYIARDKPFNFTQTHMPYFRKKMVWEIIHQQLL